MNFEKAVIKVLASEGGYVNNPKDPGGETKYGITIAVARQFGYDGSMKDLPLDIAMKIYLKNYWTPLRADEFPESIRYALLDTAVNSGVKQAIRLLQKAVRTPDDGIVGRFTIDAVKKQNHDLLLRKFMAQRLRFLCKLDTWDTFGKGWTNRICGILEES